MLNKQIKKVSESSVFKLGAETARPGVSKLTFILLLPDPAPRGAFRGRALFIYSAYLFIQPFQIYMTWITDIRGTGLSVVSTSSLIYRNWKSFTDLKP